MTTAYVKISTTSKRQYETTAYLKTKFALFQSKENTSYNTTELGPPSRQYYPDKMCYVKTTVRNYGLLKEVCFVLMQT